MYILHMLQVNTLNEISIWSYLLILFLLGIYEYCDKIKRVTKKVIT